MRTNDDDLPARAPRGARAGGEGTAKAQRAAPMIGALVLLATVQLMVVLDTTIVNVALPTIQASVGFSAPGIAWVVNGYALTFGALLLLGGRSGDLLGRRNVFMASLAAFAAASMVAGLSSSPGLLIAARVAQGASAAFAQATALSLIVSTFPAGRARNRAVGVFAAMEGLGAAAGLLLGGILVQAVSWRWVFFVNVPVAAIVAALAPRFIPSPKRQSLRLDLPGAVTASAGLGLIVFGLSRAADHGWTDIWTAGPLAAGAAALAAFVLLERRSAQPLTPLWVFADRNRGGAYMIQALVGGALFGMFFLTTLFLQHVLGYSPLKAGAAFVPATAVMMGAAGAMSRLVNRIGVRPLAATGTAIAAAGMWWLSHLHLHAGYLTGVMLPLMVLSVGLGLTFVPLTLTAVSGVKEEHSGLVSGVSTTAIQIGGSIGVAVLATVAATTARHHAGAAGAAALAAGYTQAFRVGAVIIALAVPLALVFLRLRPGGQPASDGAGIAAAAVPDDAAVTRPAVTAPAAAAAVTARADDTGAAVASPAAAQGAAVTLPAAVTPAVPRRRLLTRWCPVSATVTEGRDAPGRRMVLPAPPHRAHRLASPIPARRGRPDERQPHGSLRQPSPGRRGPGRARGRPAPCGRTPPGNRS
jgi:EmrB/QacA subfamily drug resistance transporter